VTPKSYTLRMACVFPEDIEQETKRVNHAIRVDGFAATGRDIESRVLACAAKYHLGHRVMLGEHRPAVFAPHPAAFCPLHI